MSSAKSSARARRLHQSMPRRMPQRSMRRGAFVAKSWHPPSPKTPLCAMSTIQDLVRRVTTKRLQTCHRRRELARGGLISKVTDAVPFEGPHQSAIRKNRVDRADKSEQTSAVTPVSSSWPVACNAYRHRSRHSQLRHTGRPRQLAQSGRLADPLRRGALVALEVRIKRVHVSEAIRLAGYPDRIDPDR